MVEKCRNTVVGKIFIPRWVYSTNVDFPVLNRTHTALVLFCGSNNCLIVNNNNIREMYLFKGGLHLLESSKIILAKNFVFYLNKFLYTHTSSDSVNVCSK